MYFARTLSLCLLLAAGQAAADEYVVQIGAFLYPNPSFADRAVEFGDVSTSQNAAGITRFEVGGFRGEREAKAARARLREAGYADAFVRKVGTRGTRIQDLPAVAAGPPRSDDSERVAKLPAALRARLVRLDGVLHVKEGERFTPLDEYEGGRYR